jgi:hypothetical protein
MNAFLSHLAHLWHAAYNLTVMERRRSVRAICGLSGGILTAILIWALVVARGQVGADHPLWEAIIQARMVLVRLILAVPVMILGLLAAVTAYQTLENTELGRRLMIWDISDDALVQSTKTSNAGNLLASLVLACALGLLWGVLR